MLITMSYNVYLFGAVIVGATFGHWLFAGLKSNSPIDANTIDNFASDACH